MHPRLSLEHKLPAILTAVLALTLFVAGLAGYRELRRSTATAALARLATETHQLAELSATSIVQREGLMRRITALPLVTSALASSAPPDSLLDQKLRSALAPLLLPTDTALPVVLLSPRGTPLATRGAPVTQQAATHLAHVIAYDADSMAYTPFFHDTSSVATGQIYYWVAEPIHQNKHLVGWLAQEGRLESNQGSDRRIAALLGPHTAVYFKNASDSLWSTLSGIPTPAPSALRPYRTTSVPSQAMVYDRLATDSTHPSSPHTVIAVAEQIRATPWVLVLELDQSALNDQAQDLMAKFSVFAIVLLTVAALITWLLTRQALRPLQWLTQASTAMAKGDYGVRVPESHTGHDEVATLARSFNQMIEDVGQSHQALEIARQSADQANAAKSRFLATMSHELRTPINAVLGYADLLAMELTGPLSREQHAQLARIQASTRHLLGLINEVLDLSRIESGALHLSTTSTLPGPILSEAFTMVTPQAQKKSITLTHPSSSLPAVAADPTALRQIFVNLLSNAVKFTPQDGSVTVTARRSGDMLEIAVSDTGPGIPEKDQSRLFHPFTQLEADQGTYTRRHGGAGLGLSISHNLATMMHGTLTLSSTPGHGATFTLALPLAR